MLRWLIGIILGEIICESSNWQHIHRLKITILGANWQLFRLERIAKCSYFILSTQNIKFYWFVMNIKKFLLPIWWYNSGLFPLGNKYFGVFILNGLIRIHTWDKFVNNLLKKPGCEIFSLALLLVSFMVSPHCKINRQQTNMYDKSMLHSTTVGLYPAISYLDISNSPLSGRDYFFRTVNASFRRFWGSGTRQHRLWDLDYFPSLIST